MPPINGWKSGVYCFRNRTNGKRYVGSAAGSLTARRTNHLALLRNGKHHSIHFQRAWNKYGENAFEFKVLERCSPRLCVEREQYWLDFFRTYDCRYGYNRNPKAASSLGVVRSKETRARISAAVRRRPPPSDETRAKLSLNHRQRGKPLTIKQLSAFHSVEARRKARESSRGRKLTDEQRKAISIRMQGNTNSKGRVLVEIHKIRIGAARRLVHQRRLHGYKQLPMFGI